MRSFINFFKNIKPRLGGKNLEEEVRQSTPELDRKDFYKLFSKDDISRMKEFDIAFTVIDDKNIKAADKAVYQPFGSQKPPDHIFFTRSKDERFLYISYVECKSSPNNISMWNCSLPRPIENFIYIHLNTKTQKLFVNLGTQIISEELYEKLSDLTGSMSKAADKANKKIKTIKSPIKFNIYPRKMYVQKDHYEAESILDTSPFIKYYTRITGEEVEL